MKIGDQVYKAVLDTGATLSIVARRLLKQANIRKIKTVAIGVGDGRTIHSLGGVDVTVCLGDEQVTQHCKVLDTDNFDIVIGTDFLRRNPQGKTVVFATSLCPSLRLWQWPLLCPSGAVRMKRIRSALREPVLLNWKLPVGAARLRKWTGRPAGRPE